VLTLLLIAADHVAPRQPVLHGGDFNFLGGNDVLCELANPGVRAMPQHDARHVDGALMMRDHAAEEIQIRIPGELDRHSGVHPVVRLLVLTNDKVVRSSRAPMICVSCVIHHFTWKLMVPVMGCASADPAVQPSILETESIGALSVGVEALSWG